MTNNKFRVVNVDMNEAKICKNNEIAISENFSACSAFIFYNKDNKESFVLHTSHSGSLEKVVDDVFKKFALKRGAKYGIQIDGGRSGSKLALKEYFKKNKINFCGTIFAGCDPSFSWNMAYNSSTLVLKTSGYDHGGDPTSNKVSLFQEINEEKSGSKDLSF